MVKAKKDKISVKSNTKPKKAFSEKNKVFGVISAIGGYFKGSWRELRQVRWPNRKATWGMTAAVILFTAMFVALIVSLDAVFSQLFNLIIK